MSSPLTPSPDAPLVETLIPDFARVPSARLVVTYAPAVVAPKPGTEEQALLAQLLDELLRDTSFDQWEI